MNAFGMLGSTENLVTMYTLMHADDIVLVVTIEDNSVNLINSDLLPFALRGREITVLLFMDWLNKRVDNLSRTYMNKVYIARKVGRDRELILKDSCAISIIDNFWVKRPDVETSWEELKQKRDINLELVNTALTGTLYRIDFENAVEDTTSLFTIKGAFPKAIYQGFILKKGSNAEYEFVASQIGKVLGIDVAEATIQPEQTVGCHIFTKNSLSMVHVSDLLHMTDYYVDNNRYRAIYDYFQDLDRADLVSQLERLFIFNYLLINTDFHEENMGILYDTDNFEFVSVAPAFDFNSAFEPWEDVNVFDIWIYDNLPLFINNHPDIQERLLSAHFYKTLFNVDFLTQEQRKCVWARATYLTSLCC